MLLRQTNLHIKIYLLSFLLTGCTESSDRSSLGYSLLHFTEVTSPDVVVNSILKESNCYMTSPGGDALIIPVSRVNTAARLRGAADPLVTGSTPFTAELLWSDTKELISSVKADVSDGVIMVTPNNRYLSGNAVVCARDTRGNILWSWHIWVTDYNPAKNHSAFNNHLWMDRNLGATDNVPGMPQTLGLYYQWGRKDPFPGSSSTTSSVMPRKVYNAQGSKYAWPCVDSTSPATGNLQNSILHPTVQYYCRATADWCANASDKQDNELWGSSKTIYDPCPDGWKVPTGGSDGYWNTPLPLTSALFAWNPDLPGNNLFSGGAFYPVAGCRISSSGALNSVGRFGYLWSSTVFSTDAYSLCFGSDIVNPTGHNQRAYGFSVRCVKE